MPRLPYPADHGTALRNLAIVRWLAARHDVTLVAYGNPTDREGRLALEAIVGRVVLVPFPRRPVGQRLRDFFISRGADLGRRLWSAELRDCLADLQSGSPFDVVQVEGLEMFPVWEASLGSRSRPRPFVVFDDHNAEYVLQASAWRASARRGSAVGAAYSWIQTRRLRRLERAACRAADAVLVVSPEDGRALIELDPELSPVVVPNGVDVDRYTPSGAAREPNDVFFIGKLDYRPNVDAVEWLANDIWPLVQASAPQARLFVVGRDPSRRVRNLARRSAVTVVGPVEDDRPWFARCAALLVPLRMGGGVRLKVLQAMAMGTPMISTTIGMAGTDAVPGRHYLAADSPAEFARQVVRLTTEPALGRELGAAGRRFVGERYDWRVILPRLDEVYASLGPARALERADR
jgi:glycosyltransferase involved in cell wall biosynthesis